MKILFIHQNFPGQFIHLSADLARDDSNQVVALGMEQRPAPPGVELRRYSLLRSAAPESHPLLAEQESQVLRAEACAAAAFQLKHEGFVPDIIVAHPGWGEALFIKDVFPQSRLVMYCEFYYSAEGQDVGFDPELPAVTFAQRCRLRLRNSTNLLSLEIADAAISPTQWQKSTYPDWAQDKITVIHDGIDLARLQYDPGARLTLAGPDGSGARHFQPGDEVLSYIARNLEPVRGFQVFMRTLPEVLRRRPMAHAIIVGGDEISYGHRAPSGLSWKEHMLAEVGSELDMRRVHFLGKVPYQHYLHLLSISRVHAYWTTPFVLSWSFLETASSGLPVVASRTPPVMEFADLLGVTTHDFFNLDAISGTLIERLADGNMQRRLRRVADLDLASCLRRQKRLLQSL